MAKQTRKRRSTKMAYCDAVQMITPGTRVRDAISLILQSGSGALICIGEPKRLADLSEGGVELDAPCTPQLIYELSKMDGALILNEDATRIVYANRFLNPDDRIPTDETGTRHRSAERLARQAGCVVIAVSERRSSVTLYCNDTRHVMDNVTTVLNKATQAVQTLEKYMVVLHQSMQDLDTREFQDMVTIVDVCKGVQRCEMVHRIASEIEPHILELGTEGRLIDLQVKELLQPMEESDLVVRDYYRAKGNTTYEDVQERIAQISQQELLNLGSISQALGYGQNMRSIDAYLAPRGYRMLTRTHRLSPHMIEGLVERFGSLQQIMRASKEDLVAVEGVGEVLAERIRVGLNLLRSQLALDRR